MFETYRQCVAVYHNVFQCAAMRCNALQRVDFIGLNSAKLLHVFVAYGAMCCGVMQCVMVCCGVLQTS